MVFGDLLRDREAQFLIRGMSSADCLELIDRVEAGLVVAAGEHAREPAGYRDSAGGLGGPHDHRPVAPGIL